MAYTFAEYGTLKGKQLSQLRPGALPHAQQTCTHCKTELRENFTGVRPGPEGLLCSDCYFDQLSHVIEECPVGRPGVRR